MQSYNIKIVQNSCQTLAISTYIPVLCRWHTYRRDFSPQLIDLNLLFLSSMQCPFSPSFFKLVTFNANPFKSKEYQILSIRKLFCHNKSAVAYNQITIKVEKMKSYHTLGIQT